MIAAYAIRLAMQERKLKSEWKKLAGLRKATETQAEKKAESILGGALKKSEEILERTESFKKELDENLEDIFQSAMKKNAGLLEKSASEVSEGYSNFLKKIRDEYFQATQKNLEEIREESGKQIEELSKVVEEKAENFGKTVDDKTDEEMNRVKMEIADYKAEEVRKIDESIKRLVDKTIKDVLTNEVSVDIKEKAVIEALERAKKEEIFV